MSANDIAENYDLYLGYAFKICGSHDIKGDILNEAYLKLVAWEEKNPGKEISKRFVYMAMSSVFIDKIRKDSKSIVTNKLEKFDIPDETCLILESREEISDILSEMKFEDREILLLTAQNSLRKVAKKYGYNHVTLHFKKQKALIKLKERWENRKKNI